MREELLAGERAGLGRRLVADGCDAAIGATIMAAAYVLLSVLPTHEVSTSGWAPYGVEIAFAAWFLWNLTYSVGATGQSWGRRVARVRVISQAGTPIGVWRALGRNLFAIHVSAMPLVLGFLWVMWDGEKQAWHDKALRTFVVKV